MLEEFWRLLRLEVLLDLPKIEILKLDELLDEPRPEMLKLEDLMALPRDELLRELRLYDILLLTHLLTFN